MIKVNRSVRIEWRNNPSSFELRNKKAFKTDFLRLGSAIRPVNALLSRSEELRVLLPTVLGVSPNDSSWQERVSTYLNDFLLEIPIQGLNFDTSYTLDLGNPALKTHIDERISKLKKSGKIKDETGSALEDIVLTEIKTLKEEELYKYVTFYNIPDYISWRYCLLSSKVANKVEDVDKSVNIQFYLTSDSERKAIKAARTKIKSEAMAKYTELMSSSDSSKIDNVIVASNRVFDYSEFKALSKDDKETILLELVESDPKKFIDIVSDKHLNSKAIIIIYQWMNILKTLPNSSVIVDASNPERIVGNNINDAISYFSNDTNKGVLSEWNAKYRSLKG